MLPSTPLFYIDRQGRRQELGLPSTALRGRDASIPEALEALRLEFGNLVLGLLTQPPEPTTVLDLATSIRAAAHKVQEACWLELARQRPRISTPTRRPRPSLDSIAGDFE